jgi:hypothetical protein
MVGASCVGVAFHHVDRFPRTVFRAQLAANTDLFIDNDNTVDGDVAVLVRIFGTGDFIQAIDGAELDAYLASGTAFGMDDRDERRLLLFARGRRHRRFRRWYLRCCGRFAHAVVGALAEMTFAILGNRIY